MKTKQMMTAAAMFCCAMVMAVLTACSMDDNPVTPTYDKIVGRWYADASGTTYALWNYDKTWQTMEFKADGTGEAYVFFTLSDDRAIARQSYTFSYTTTADGQVKIVTDKETRNAQYQVVGGKLQLTLDGFTVAYAKCDDSMAAKFDAWSKKDALIDVPEPAKYTVFVYGNANGQMDYIIENGFWDEAKKFLTDHDNVRVVCFYKFGKPFTDKNGQEAFYSRYGEPGDIVWFELTDKTDLTNLKEKGFQSLEMGDFAKNLKLCDPNTVRAVIELGSLVCPAEDYVFAIWGHGSGFVPWTDVPGKYDFNLPLEAPQQVLHRGVIGDEWNEGEQLDMYELHDAIKASGIDRLSALYFHNCLMGNMETLTEVTDCADYIFTSSHSLMSDGTILTEFVRGLIDKGNVEDAGYQMFERGGDTWAQGYTPVKENGDFKMIRTSKFDAILDACKHMATRLQELYPTQQEAIDRATRQVYRFFKYERADVFPFFDVADYAHQLAKETQDAEFATIAQEVDQAFNDALLAYRDVSITPQHLDHYTLSLCLFQDVVYLIDLKGAGGSQYDIWEGYEMSTFHNATGWGNWLRMNKQKMNANPYSGGGLDQ